MRLLGTCLAHFFCIKLLRQPLRTAASYAKIMIPMQFSLLIHR